MIGFVVPIKPRRFSSNWQKDNRLLERTLGAMLSQTNQDFKIFIPYTDKPEISFDHPAICWIPFDLPFVETKDIVDFETRIKRWMPDPVYVSKMFDKGRKIRLGCQYAKEAGCHFIMAVDSDDLISNKLAQFVNEAPKDSVGWVLRNGYMHLESLNILIKKKDIFKVNGSTNIINEKYVPNPNFESKYYYDFNFFEGHGYLPLRMKEMYNKQQEALPFVGVVYTIHSDNASHINKILSLKNIKTLAKIALHGKLMNKKIVKEFNLIKV